MGKINHLFHDDKFFIPSIDVMSIPKMKKNYRILIDVKGRFVLKSISS